MSSTWTSWRQLIVFLIAYWAVLFIVQSHLPLWLDEIIDLQLVCSRTYVDLIRAVPQNSGAVPLGYLSQKLAIGLAGGRFVSVVSSLAAISGVYVLALQIGLRWPMLVTLIYSLCPLQLRYAMEARPYCEALAFSVWATVWLLSLVHKPRWWRAALYAACVVLGIYTFPYTIFVPAGHLAWLTFRPPPEGRKVLAMVVTPVALAGLLFVPWYVFARASWAGAIQAEHIRTGINLRTSLLILREITGSGYLGWLLLIPTIAFAPHWRGSYLRAHAPSLLLCMVLSVVSLAIACDLAAS